MIPIRKVTQMEMDRLKAGFTSRARSIFWVRMGLVLLNTFLIFRSEWLGEWPELIQWLASLATFITLAYAIVSLKVVDNARWGRWSHFITLNLDVAWLICIVLLTGGLFSPLMALTPIFTVLFALLFNNPWTIIPPLLSLPLVTILHPFIDGRGIGRNELLVIMAYGLIQGIVLYVTSYNLSHEEQQNRDILRLERKLGKMAVVEERNRLAREIHDGVGGTLSAIIIQSEYVLTMPDLSPRARVEIGEIKSAAEEAIDEVRRAVTMMRGDFQLIPQLKNFCANFTARNRIPILLDISGDSQAMTHDAELTFFRILQECLNNIAKHSEAKEVRIDVAFTNGDVSLRIVDNGKGFDVSEAKPLHYGLLNMKERAKKMGAQFSIESKPSGGTCATFRSSVA
jgi:two-component system sensor histidine kinase DegS